jgi:hypothetical protein
VKDALKFGLCICLFWVICYFLDNGLHWIHGGVSSVLADGSMRGPLGFIWNAFVWFVYIALVIGVCAAAYLVLGFFGLGVWLIEKIGGLIAKVKSAWFGSSDVTDPKKLPTAIRNVLSEFQRRIKDLEAKTKDLQPPPPPKSKDELIAELTQELAKLRAGGVRNA